MHHIVNTLGWRSLRPLQAEAIEPLVGGGRRAARAHRRRKDRGGDLPAAERHGAARWTGLSVIYVCPFKALLNNLQPRLENLRIVAGSHRRPVARRHHAVGPPADPARSTGHPPHHARIARGEWSASRSSISTSMAGLRAVVVDEVHAFAGDDRGWHLLAVLERLSNVAGRQIQRVGLSATVGNPTELLTWIQGSGAGHPSGEGCGPGHLAAPVNPLRRRD